MLLFGPLTSNKQTCPYISGVVFPPTAPSAIPYIPQLSFRSVVQSLLATSALWFVTCNNGGCWATEQWLERRKFRALSSTCLASVEQQE
jgi:hypothetical protein